jgi:hypothetical protein
LHANRGRLLERVLLKYGQAGRHGGKSDRPSETDTTMSANIDLKACAILERLSAEMVDAEVDYSCTQDFHEFLVTTGGMKHELGFSERVLEVKDIPDIEQVVSRLADELKAATAPRRIRIGARART